MELNSPSAARKPPKQGHPTSPETPSPVRGHLEEVRRFKAGEKLSRSFRYWRKRSVPISFFFFLVDNITTWWVARYSPEFRYRLAASPIITQVAKNGKVKLKGQYHFEP